jgi:Ca2+-binding EF-hand superfamily protein
MYHVIEKIYSYFFNRLHCILPLYNKTVFVSMIQVFDLFDEKKNGVIDFDEFIHALSIFHPLAPVEEKISCMFPTS